MERLLVIYLENFRVLLNTSWIEVLLCIVSWLLLAIVDRY